MDKRKLSLLLKRNIKKIQNKDLYDYLDNFAVNSSELSLNNKIQISNFEKSLMDVKDLKKLLNYLSKITGFCVFIVSKDHLFYSGSDKNSDFSTYKKLESYRKSIERIEIIDLIARVNDKSRVHDFNLIVDPKLDKTQVEDSLLLSTNLPGTSLSLGFLGSLDSDIDLLVGILKYLSNSQTFNERLSRIFN
jgi:hypothetical protein